MAELTVRRLGRREYEPVWHAMQRFTETRDERSGDELWQVEHPPVFTLGMNGREEHLGNTGPIPVVRIDRGGQVTYHGPGQAVVYLLLDLKRRRLGVRQVVETMEAAVIALLDRHGIAAHGRRDAPGVYVGAGESEAKIAALGLRVRRGRCYHGLALNVAMDLSPFSRIDPCGHPGMAVTQLADLLPAPPPLAELHDELCRELARQLGYNRPLFLAPEESALP